MGIHDLHRIDEVYHSMYKIKFCREEAFEQNEDLAEDEEYKSKAKSHAPEAAKAIMHKLKLEYGDKFNPEKARAAVKHALGSATEEDCEGWMQDYSHTPEQKREMAKYVKSPAGEAAEEHGVDPNEAKEYDQARKDISYEKYSAWDAFHAVKEGAWTDDDFVQWTRSVWSAGAEESQQH